MESGDLGGELSPAAAIEVGYRRLSPALSAELGLQGEDRGIYVIISVILANPRVKTQIISDQQAI
jgi:hypothetical protein